MLPEFKPFPSLKKKKKSETNYNVFKAETLLWSHLVPRVPLHLWKHLHLEALLCLSGEHFIFDFSLQSFPKKTEITSKHGMPLTSNPWQSSGIILLCRSAKHITRPSEPQEAVWAMERLSREGTVSWLLLCSL